MIASHDPWIAAHAREVSERCAAMGVVLGLHRRRREQLGLAGSLHDIGKLLLPAEIVDKPGPLDDAETAMMRRHPELGAELVAGAGLHEVAHIVRHHHERVDGGGYPDGLRGDEIPLEARIVHVADAFDAMTSDRPYAKARSEDEAILEVVRNAGRQFDQRCVAALLATLVPAAREQGRVTAPLGSTLEIVACATAR